MPPGLTMISVARPLLAPPLSRLIAPPGPHAAAGGLRLALFLPVSPAAVPGEISTVKPIQPPTCRPVIGSDARPGGTAAVKRKAIARHGSTASVRP